MTQKPKPPYPVLGSDVSGSGNGQGQFDPAIAPNANLQRDTPPAPPDTETRTIPLLDRSGKRVHRELTKAEWWMLYERRLVTLQWTNRKRNRIAEVRLAAGVSVAAVNAALRQGLRDRLPMPPPTVIRVNDKGLHYEHNHKVCRGFGPPCERCGGYHEGECGGRA